ncbi:MAG: MopE-related protein [Candidatus Brocadiales bacterium]
MKRISVHKKEEIKKKWHLSLYSLVKISILVTLVGLCTAAFSPDAGATHFRFGHITWKPVGGTDIEFKITQAWRGTAFGSPLLGDTFVDTFSGSFNFGDGSSAGLTLTVTSLDLGNDWIVGQATLTHTYAANGDFTAFFEGCCRVSNCADPPSAHINNPDGNERTETVVNVGTGNSSPVSSLPPIIVCPENGLCTFTVVALDPDGDPLSYRLSTSAEAGGGFGFTQPGLPHAPNAASIDPNTGVYTWDTTGATLTANPATCPNTLYSTQVMIEDGPYTISGTSQVPLDFLIQLVPVVGVPPVFDDPPTPACGSTITGNIGSLMSFTIQASDPDVDDIVSLNVAGMPPSATMTPSLPTSGNAVSSTFNWTPTPGEAGVFAMSFTATDSNAQQALCTITVQVFVEDCTNGTDDDGDGLTDCADPDCRVDVDGDGFIALPCGDDCDNTNPAVNPGAAELCSNGIDDNCDNQVDEECPTCTDNDGDGFFAESGCDTPVDCNDNDPAINPGVKEVEDGEDNDCDGLVDREDPDCICESGIENNCNDGVDDDGDGLTDCTDPDCQIKDADGDGFIASPCGDDCDDTDPAVNPGATESCDDGVDNDCDGLVDCADPDCVTSTTYSKGKSFIRFKHNKTSKAKAYLRMCVPKAFCDIIKADPAAKEIVLTLGGCSSMIIPGSSLKPTKFGFRAKSAPGETPKYVVKINCKREWLKLRLKKVDLKNCVSVSEIIKTCVSITGIPCLCAEKEFKFGKRDKVGRLKKLSLRGAEVCSP